MIKLPMLAVLPLLATLTVPAIAQEMLPAMDADLVLLTDRAEQGETAQDAYDQLEAAVPGFCTFLTACQNGRVIAVPRDEVFVSSYGALGMLAYSMIALTATPAN